jgi:hypothetical protein
MAGVNANFQLGLSATVGTAAQSRSYAYDESQYVQTDPVQFALSGSYPTGTATGAAIIGTATAVFVTAFNKQLRSMTVVPIAGTAVLAAGGDYFQIYLCTPNAQAFGTATAASTLVAGVSTGTFYGSSTNTGTSWNVVQIFNVMTFMTGQGGAVVGTGKWGSSGTAAPVPQTVQLAGGTFTVVVSGPAGTNTQGGYVFPIGPNGGLTIQPGEVLIVSKGTDTVMQYVGELELTFSPGGLVTR